VREFHFVAIGILEDTEEGMVQAVEGIPVDVTIEMRNYDASDGDEEMVTKGENGKSCEIREWQAPE
jgi:hypothetical protein